LNFLNDGLKIEKHCCNDGLKIQRKFCNFSVKIQKIFVMMARKLKGNCNDCPIILKDFL